MSYLKSDYFGRGGHMHLLAPHYGAICELI